MSKPRATYYIRYGDLIISSSIQDAYGPDGLDELRLQVMRGFSEGMNYVDAIEAAEPVVPDPGTVDTTNLPPVE